MPEPIGVSLVPAPIEEITPAPLRAGSDGNDNHPFVPGLSGLSNAGTQHGAGPPGPPGTAGRDETSGNALAVTTVGENPAFVGQISDSVRAVYIAQVDASPERPRLALRSGTTVLGDVQVQVAHGSLSVHIGQVLDLFQNEMDAGQFAHLRNSAAAQEFISLDRLRSAGIPILYNPAYDELVLQQADG